MKRKYVLRKHGINPNRSQRFVAYTETLFSEPIEIFGVKACTIFTESDNTRRKAMRLGWKDETTAYYEDKMQKDNILKNKKIEDDKLKEEEEKSKQKRTTKRTSKNIKKSTKTNNRTTISTATKTK